MIPKLVRDKIPAIIRAKGQVPVTYVAGAGEYASRLRDKLTEEVGEFLVGGDPYELPDVLEVVYALAGHAGISRDQLEAMRAEKAEAHGGFAGRVVWLGNQDALTGEDKPDDLR